jgi:hypothetical protein
MKAIIGAHGLWDIVEKRYETSEDETVLTVAQIAALQKKRKDDQQYIELKTCHHCAIWNLSL